MRGPAGRLGCTSSGVGQQQGTFDPGLHRRLLVNILSSTSCRQHPSVRWTAKRMNDDSSQLTTATATATVPAPSSSSSRLPSLPLCLAQSRPLTLLQAARHPWSIPSRGASNPSSTISYLQQRSPFDALAAKHSIVHPCLVSAIGLVALCASLQPFPSSHVSPSRRPKAHKAHDTAELRRQGTASKSLGGDWRSLSLLPACPWLALQCLLRLLAVGRMEIQREGCKKGRQVPSAAKWCHLTHQNPHPCRPAKRQNRPSRTWIVAVRPPPFRPPR